MSHWINIFIEIYYRYIYRNVSSVFYLKHIKCILYTFLHQDLSASVAPHPLSFPPTSPAPLSVSLIGAPPSSQPGSVRVSGGWVHYPHLFSLYTVFIHFCGIRYHSWDNDYCIYIFSPKVFSEPPVVSNSCLTSLQVSHDPDGVWVFLFVFLFFVFLGRTWGIGSFPG